RQFSKRTGILRIGNRAELEAEIPDIPVIHAATRILFATVSLIKNDSGVRPDGAGKLLVETGSEHRPLAAERMADDSNTRRIDVRALRENRVCVGRGVR